MTLLSILARKSYGGAVALRDASLSCAAGETVAPMGENGAGKSTLIKILAGAVAPDGGRDPARRARAPEFGSPGEAHRRGLRFIHQELNVVLALSVAENIFLGRAYPQRVSVWSIGARSRRSASRRARRARGQPYLSPTRASGAAFGGRPHAGQDRGGVSRGRRRPRADLRDGRADGGASTAKNPSGCFSIIGDLQRAGMRR